MGAYADIKSAVLGKQPIVFDYGGHRREVCPHVIGLKDGKQQFLGFQFAGSSSSGLPANGEWRCFVISRIGAVTVQPGPWQTGAGHQQDQTCVDQIDAEVIY